MSLKGIQKTNSYHQYHATFSTPATVPRLITPKEPNKANQDSYAVVPNFCGDEMSLFCAVFDGHGGAGDLCSNFVAETLPKVFSCTSTVSSLRYLILVPGSK